MKRPVCLLGAAVALLLATPAIAHPGACCLPDGTCLDVDVKGQCDWAGGEFTEGASCSDEGVCALECRMTGGGNDTYAQEWDGTYGEGETNGNGNGNRIDRYTFGGEAGAPTASDPQPFGEWTHRQHNGPSGRWTFHGGQSSARPGTEISSIECSDPGYCNPARPAPAHQLDFVGVGEFETVNRAPDSFDGVVEERVTLHCFEVHIEDAGEPGSAPIPDGADCPETGHAGGMVNCECPDFYSITIHATDDCSSDEIYHVWGYITGGNFQIHPPVGSSI
jgi:hypothetical protein